MDAEDLTQEQIEEFRQTLVALRKELTAAMESSAQASKPVELDQSAFGRVSRIDAIQQQQMSKAYRSRLSIRLQQIKAALAAIERDEFGYCNSCGEPIALKRLRVKPEAPICLECQSERER